MQQISRFFNLFIVFMMIVQFSPDLNVYAFSSHEYYDEHDMYGYGNSYGNVKCDVCDLSIIAIEDYLDSNHTLTELEQSLDAICSKTPLSTVCTNLVNSYLPQIISYLEQKENPQTICNQLGFCSNNPSIHYKYDFCNSLSRLYTNLRQNKMTYFSNDCTSYNCTKTSFILSKHVYLYLHTFVMKHRLCNGLLLPVL